jgi:two-component system sensor histidine kinase UhpB
MKAMKRPRITRSGDSLIGQVVAANVVLVGLTILAASLAAGLDLTIQGQRWQFLILALAIMLSLCVNLWMLQRRFAPLERLIQRVERVDPADPGSFRVNPEPATEVDRLAQSFKRLLDRVEAERRRSGRLVIRAQEEERRRLARDLHDEVNQSLTAILLRLEALAQEAEPAREAEVAELKKLVNQAMEDLSGLARQLRPAALDDHGLVPAIDTQLARFSARTGVEGKFHSEGDLSDLSEDEQTAIYRVAQEALANAGRHAQATRVSVDLRGGPHGTELRVVDDGRGFDPSRDGSGRLGLKGMAERARLVGGALDVRSEDGSGTTVTLTVP